MTISYACQNLNFSTFGMIGKCFVEFGFFGDATLLGLVVFSVFAGFVVRYNMPGNLLLPLGCALSYVLWIGTGMPHFFVLLALSLIMNGVLVVLAMMNYINR